MSAKKIIIIALISAFVGMAFLFARNHQRTAENAADNSAASAVIEKKEAEEKANDEKVTRAVTEAVKKSDNISDDSVVNAFNDLIKSASHRNSERRRADSPSQ